MCIEKLTNFVQSSFKIYRLQKKYQKLCQLYTSTHFKIDKKIGPQTQRAFIISCNLDMLCNKVTKYQVPFLQQPSHCACSKMSKTDLCGSRFVLSSVIDCRPKGYQTTSDASPSQWPKQIFSACMGDFRCELWTPEKSVVRLFEYLPRIHNWCLFQE